MISEKALLSIEVEKNEHKYIFMLPLGVPYGEAYDAAFEVLGKITEMSQLAKDKAKRKEEDALQGGDEVVPEVTR